MGEPAGNSALVGSCRALGFAFAALIALTLFQIVLGALVRANGAGLACPDWPLCFGEVIPRFDVGVAYEWSHRAVAGIVSLGFAALGGLTYRLRPVWPRVRMAYFSAAAILGMQVVLGGLTVLLKLAPWTVTAHLLMGLAFCAVLLWIARDLFEWGDVPDRRPVSAALRGMAIGAVGLAFVQILLGGLVSSQYAGLACTHFPTCDGVSLAPTWSGLVGLHVIHRLNALLLVLFLGAFVWAARSAPRVHRLAFLTLRLVLVQIGVGVLNVLVALSVEVTAIHTGCAAGIALLLCLALREVALSGRRETARSDEAGPLEAQQVV